MSSNNKLIEFLERGINFLFFVVFFICIFSILSFDLFPFLYIFLFQPSKNNLKGKKNVGAVDKLSVWK